ncbi:hypothetical protein FXV83_11185 [Bradyrhizobium hipponense]|uniref:Uncharacterized protein n=2 Tax=Bradyrhizobium hipponense TaxID=2605638 RepID=A0A5S4YQ29_9BRAD|nr:hypothetical protein FXV83_11185 [Bradyrhizobium hipponense]
MIMGKPRSRQPADIARARRRSLVALTAEVSRAVDEGLAMPPGSVTVDRQDAPQIAQAAPASTTVPTQEAASVIAATIEPPGSTTADLILDMAKDCQARALEGMKAGAHVALDYAKDLAKPRLAGGAPEVEGVAAAESHLIEAIGTAAECRTVVLELMKVNAGATLEYARELGRATTFADLVELSSAHARKQCELVLKQTELLKSLAQNIAKPGAR